VLDEAEELIDETTFERIDLSIRHKTLPNRVILVMNPSTYGHFLYRMFVQAGKRPDTLYIHTTWEDNRHNLSQSFVEKAEQIREQNPARYKHIFGGLWSKEKPGLLWTRAEIERCRVPSAPELSRVVVGVDPAATSKMESNETGIVVVGVDRQRRAYVLEDLSGRYTPNQWATVTIEAARRWKGSIVAETNQGGDMVTSVIRSIGDRASGVRIIDVRASRGKYARAEPVYSLYTENRVFHVGEFPILEQQMAGFNPDDDTESPDRVDALVWGLTAGLLNTVNAFVV
jgi:phage terminase large subunit-like protein